MKNSAEADTCEVIDNNQQKANKPQEKLVRDEASKKEDDFYDVEEHTYSDVNKKKAKETSEDSEGERARNHQVLIQQWLEILEPQVVKLNTKEYVHYS